MSKVVIEVIEKALARKQKQLAKLEHEIDIWVNGCSILYHGYADAIEKAKEANKKGDYKKALHILEAFDKKKAEINRILSKDITELFDKRWKIESEIRELAGELSRLNVREMCR